MEPDQLPHRSRRLLQLPPHFESFPSKRRKVIIRGTYTSTYQTCDHTRMSIESSQKDTGSPSTPIPTIVNDTPSTPSTTMVVVSEGSYHHTCAHVLETCDPISYSDAQGQPEWEQAMQDEMNHLLKNHLVSPIRFTYFLIDIISSSILLRALKYGWPPKTSLDNLVIYYFSSNIPSCNSLMTFP
jgi:hypothetical protein